MRAGELRKGWRNEEKARDLESDLGYKVANGTIEAVAKSRLLVGIRSTMSGIGVIYGRGLARNRQRL